jgi:hypothetical protein
MTRAMRFVKRLLHKPSTALVIAIPVFVVAAGFGGAVSGKSVQLLTGSAWLTSSAGQVILVSGSAARRVAAFQVATANQKLSTVQTSEALYIINHDESHVSRLDSGTFELSPPLPVAGAGARLQVAANADHVYVIDGNSGVLRTVHPRSLTETEPPRNLKTTVDPGSAVVDSGGRLWVLGDDGRVRWAASNGAPEVVLAGPGSKLLLAGGTPVLIGDGSAWWLAQPGGTPAEVKLGVNPGDAPIFGGTGDGRLLVVIPGRKIVMVCGPGGCDTAVGQLVDPGPRLGVPQLVDDVILVPDLDNGTVHLVPVGGGVELSQAKVMPIPADFDLNIRDGFIFYNAVGNENAGLLRINGAVRPVKKYEPTNPNQGLDTPAAPLSSDPTLPSAEAPVETPVVQPTDVIPPTTGPSKPATKPPTTITTQPGPGPSVGPSQPTDATEELRIQVVGDGTVTADVDGGAPTTCVTTCSVNVRVGATVTLSGQPDPDREGPTWTSPAPTFVMNAPTTVTATFTVANRDVIVMVGPHGKVVSTPTGINCPPGECRKAFPATQSVQLRAIADPGWGTPKWEGAATCSTGETCDVNPGATVRVTFLDLTEPTGTISFAGHTVTMRVEDGQSGVASATLTVTYQWSCPLGFPRIPRGTAESKEIVNGVVTVAVPPYRTCNNQIAEIPDLTAAPRFVDPGFIDPFDPRLTRGGTFEPAGVLTTVVSAAGTITNGSGLVKQVQTVP